MLCEILQIAILHDRVIVNVHFNSDVNWISVHRALMVETYIFGIFFVYKFKIWFIKNEKKM